MSDMVIDQPGVDRADIDGPDINRIVRAETMISIAINALIPAGIIWALAVTPPVTLLGGTGLVQGMLKGAGLATFLMTLVLTTILRARMRKGGLPCGQPATAPGRFLPANLLLRSIVLAVAAAVLLVPVGAAAAALLRLLPLSRNGLFAFNVAFGALVGLVMTAPLVRRALAEPC